MQQPRKPQANAGTIRRSASLGEGIGRAISIVAYGLLLIVSIVGGIGGCGYLLYAEATNADPSFLLGAATLAVAMAILSIQQLQLAGLPLLRLRALSEAGGHIDVPRSGVAMGASGLACFGFAVWCWIFWADFGLAPPTILFGCAALILAPLTVSAWRKFRTPFRLTAEGIEYAAGWRGVLYYDDIAAAELRVRSIPYLVLHMKQPRAASSPPCLSDILASISQIISGIAPPHAIAVSVFDLAVQPLSLLEAIDRRIRP